MGIKKKENERVPQQYDYVLKMNIGESETNGNFCHNSFYRKPLAVIRHSTDAFELFALFRSQSCEVFRGRFIVTHDKNGWGFNGSRQQQQGGHCK